MVVGIVGLGLIGGSAAKAFKAAGATVLACDINEPIVSYAQLEGTVDAVLDAGNIGRCNLLLLTATPKAVAGYLRDNAMLVNPKTLVIDFCGTKRKICELGFALAAQYGFTFVGGHPMAGLQYSGYKYSKATLFSGASFIIVPPVHDDIELLDRVKHSLEPLGFKKFMVTTADFHDRMISYTSQMCHVVSNAFIKSPSAKFHRGYSAGSFRDFTRVSRLNEDMWTELFLENKEHLLGELDLLINSLYEYRNAIATDDANLLRGLLRDGRIAKEETEK
ncbi:MAG: prephenate dehydrogenase/arogenate dehydrogenase family protein [Bacteroidaceae bacterium]|nr:prephenate dehydrogenase/arogenate dehydrogenase family protein [Bacteroidaceae bacterium]